MQIDMRRLTYQIFQRAAPYAICDLAKPNSEAGIYRIRVSDVRNNVSFPLAAKGSVDFSHFAREIRRKSESRIECAKYAINCGQLAGLSWLANSGPGKAAEMRSKPEPRI